MKPTPSTAQVEALYREHGAGVLAYLARRVPDPDTAAAAAYMRWVAAHPADARALGARARARIEAKYGPAGLAMQQ